MHYYKYCDDETFPYTYQCFAELDNEYYCLRTVYQTPEGLINSFTNGVEHLHGLPEGSWADILAENEPSNAQEFEQIWSQSLLPFKKAWQNLKEKTYFHQTVNLKVVCFYPQGVVLKFDEIFYALADYNQCLAKFGQKNMYPNHYFDLSITGFDDINMIILVG